MNTSLFLITILNWSVLVHCSEKPKWSHIASQHAKKNAPTKASSPLIAATTTAKQATLNAPCSTQDNPTVDDNWNNYSKLSLQYDALVKQRRDLLEPANALAASARKLTPEILRLKKRLNELTSPTDEQK